MVIYSELNGRATYSFQFADSEKIEIEFISKLLHAVVFQVNKVSFIFWGISLVRIGVNQYLMICHIQYLLRRADVGTGVP